MSKRSMEDFQRAGMIDALQCGREESTDYVPPPRGVKWRLFRAIGMLPIQSNDKAVLALIVDHANPTTGRADPGQLRIGRLLGLKIRTVKRSIARLRRTPYLSRTLRGLSSTAYHVNWSAILRHDRAYETNKRCQTCPLDGDRAVPLVVSDLSPKNEKGKRKEKTKHEMAPSDEGAFLEVNSKWEESGIQEVPTSLNRSASQFSLSFWRERERNHTQALICETDPDRRTALEAKLSRVRTNLRKATQ
jgi:hypothetical protein